MKIFATGDTHWNFERFRPEYFPEGQELTKKDVVLQLGDFGGVWFGDKRDDEALDTLLQTELPEAELYLEIGRAICARPEKGAAVMAAEYLQANYPECGGFSPRNLRRMREFYRAYADSRGLRALALKLGWTQNVAILEGCEGSQERTWYLRAALEHRWTKSELLEQIQAGAWLQSTLDEQTDSCYTEENTESVECLEHEENPFCVSRQYLSEPDGRVCHERSGEKSGPGGRVSNRLGGYQPGGDRQPGLPSGSWRSTAYPARATPPGSSAAATTRSTTCSLGWTRPTSTICSASAAAISTTRCISCWSTPADRIKRWRTPGIRETLIPPGRMCWRGVRDF